MTEVKVEQLTEELALGEGPHWDVDQQCLFFVNILDHTIHKFDPATNKHTKTKLDGRVGFIIPVSGTRDQFVVGVEQEVAVVRWDGGEGSPAPRLRTLARLDPAVPGTRINDAKADPEGRLFAGTMGKEDPPGNFSQGQGSLYRVDRAGAAVPVERGLGIANGLAWDVARKAFYYIDSLDYCVRRYDYDIATGEISNKTVLFDLQREGVGGMPDGMTIDSAGCLWVANFNGSQLLVVEPSGRLTRRVAVPALQVTSAAWGGARLDELYVTSASMDLGTPPPPPSGALFRLTGLDARGLPMTSVRLDSSL